MYSWPQTLDHGMEKIRCIQTDAVGSNQSTKCSSPGLRRRCIGSTQPEGNRAASRIGRYCTLPGDAGRRPAALGSGCADESGRLTVGRSKTEAETRTVYLMPASVEALGAIRPADANGESSVFGLSAASISRRIRGGGPGTGFSRAFGARGHGRGRRAHA